jgi:drug/metabolite transporter (DMT)-like permease
VWYFIGAIAAVLLGAGFVLQQDAAQRVPQSDFLRARLVADLLRQRRWLAGLGFMIAGMLLSAWVIGHMVLALSEPLLATNLLVALVIAGRVSGQKPQAQELVGAVILLAGVSALSVARSVTSVQDSVGSPAYWPYAGAAIAAAAACFAIAGRRRQGDLRGLLTGTAAGLVLGIQDAITRVTVRDLDSVHDVILLLTSWPAYSLVAVGVIALWLMQSAFSSAPLHASLPGVTAAEPVSGIVLGVVAFRENVPASPLLIALQVAGLIMLVVGVILVARAPALSGLQKVRVPGERLLRREREQRRTRPPAVALQVSTGLASPPPGLPGPVAAGPASSGPAGAGSASPSPSPASPSPANSSPASPSPASSSSASSSPASPSPASPSPASPGPVAPPGR